MAITSEEIQLRIVASGNAAKRELAELGEQQDTLKRKIDGLNKRSKDYAATKRKLQNELKGVNERMRKLRGEIDLNTMSMRDLRNRARDLKRVMDNMNPDSPEWKRLNGDLKKVNGRMRELRGSTSQLRGGFDGLKGMLSKGLAIGVAVQGARQLFDIGKRAVQAFTEQAQAVEKVSQAIKSTAGAAGFSLSQLREEASELQKRTLFGDEEILNNATAQLLTFTNIANDEFMRTQRVALDLSTVLDGDLKSASIQLGKALNDPVANLSALSRSGIQFSAAQKEVIKDLANSNRLAEAQSVILDELERQYGGQAEAAARVGGGWQQLGNVLGDTMEELGGFITALFNTDQATSGLMDIIGKLNDGIREWAANVLQARQWMRDWYNESETVRGAINLFTAAFRTNLAVIMQFLDVAIVQPFKMILAGVKAARLAMKGEFQAAGGVMVDQFKAYRDDWAQFGTDIKNIWTGAMEEIKDPEPWQAATDNSKKAMQEMKQNAVDAVAQAQLDIEKLRSLGQGERGGGVQGGEMDQEFLQKQLEFKAVLEQLNRSAREQELLEEEMYWNELMSLNKKYMTGATDLEERKREAMAQINAKWNETELNAVMAQENAKQEIKRETFMQTAQLSSQMLGFIGQYMEKGSAAQIAVTSAQIAVDTASAISSAINGATQAASQKGAAAPFLIMGYITSMVGSVFSAFTQVKSMMDAAKAAKIDTDLDVPAFATGTKGASVTPPGWKLVGEEGPELLYTPGGEKVVTAPDTEQILSKYNMGNIASAIMGGSTMPTPSYYVDTNALGASVKQPVSAFANGTMGAYQSFSSDISTTLSQSNNDLSGKLDMLIAAVKEEKKRPAIVSQRQLKDRADDLNYIKGFSDIKN
jgi:predicted nuclease with TOPRIM domain